jgi:uncharacterized membrane protein YkvA (DUF1232 family)
MRDYDPRQSDRPQGFLSEAMANLRLAWRLFRDPDVPAWAKLIPLLALAYVLFPADLIPDLIPGLGQVDDLTLFVLGLKYFIEACPSSVVQRHRGETGAVDASYRVVEDEAYPAEGPARLPGNSSEDREHPQDEL